MKRFHIYFSGKVQGVGFRFTCYRLASSLGLTGWVKNLPDGRVEMEMQGSEDKLNAFLKQIQQDGFHHIAHFDKEEKNCLKEEHAFDIRYF